MLQLTADDHIAFRCRMAVGTTRSIVCHQNPLGAGTTLAAETLLRAPADGAKAARLGRVDADGRTLEFPSDLAVQRIRAAAT
jgi:hypothetical protein